MISDKSLIKEINRNVFEWFKISPSKYTMVCRVNFSPNNLIKGRRFKFDGVSIELCNEIPSYMNVDARKISSTSRIIQDDPGYGGYLIARFLARTSNDAADKAFGAVDLFLSVYNLIAKSWNLFGTQGKPESSMRAGPYYLFFRKRNLIKSGGVWINENYRKEFWELSTADVKKFNKCLANLRKSLLHLEAHPLRSAISSSFLMMNEGMEAYDMSRRTLRYWTALERLFQVEDERLAYDRIINRATYLDNPENFASVKLKRLVRIINRYVHYGHTENEHHQLTQFLADHIKTNIFYLLFNGDDFIDHREFVDMTDLPSSSDALARRSRAIERRQLMIAQRRHRID